MNVPTTSTAATARPQGRMPWVQVVGGAALALLVATGVGLWQASERTPATPTSSVSQPLEMMPDRAVAAPVPLYLVASAAEAQELRAGLAAVEGGADLAASVLVVDEPTAADALVFLLTAGGVAYDLRDLR